MKRLQCLIFERSRQLGEVPEDWERAKSRSRPPAGRGGGAGLLSPTSTPWKVREKILPESVSNDTKDEKVVGRGREGGGEGTRRWWGGVGGDR